MLQVGDVAPSFVLDSTGGNKVDSATLQGLRHVIYFYPKDDTPGCTRQACALRDSLPAFEHLGVPVFGVSGDPVKAHDKFASKHALNFPLLSDPGHGLLEAYGVWVEKSMYGRKYFGIQRSTFVVDGGGKIEHVWEKVSPDSHAGQVLTYLAGALPSTKKITRTKPQAKPGTVVARAAKARR